jgi:hypothetical protein
MQVCTLAQYKTMVNIGIWHNKELNTFICYFDKRVGEPLDMVVFRNTDEAGERELDPGWPKTCRPVRI